MANLRRLSLTLILFFFTLPLEGANLQVKAGAFSITAETETDEGSLSNFGAYQFAFQSSVGPRLTLNIGYTVNLADSFGGDMGFGFDLGFSYYPFSQPQPLQVDSVGGTVIIQELWRPYVGAGFQERRFQSVEANYSGFALVVGTERQLNFYKLSGVAELRYATMLGRSESTAEEILFLLGVSIPF